MGITGEEDEVLVAYQGSAMRVAVEELRQVAKGGPDYEIEDKMLAEIAGAEDFCDSSGSLIKHFLKYEERSRQMRFSNFVKGCREEWFGGVGCEE